MKSNSDSPVTTHTSSTFQIGGNTRVHRLGFGAMRITGRGIWGEPADRDEAIRVLRRAIELGVNFIDTADSYGPEVSERLIAEALYPYPVGLVIASKAGFVRPGPDAWTVNGKPSHLRAACEGSLRRLRVERIDLFQLHRIDPKYPLEDQIGAFQDLQSEGKIRHIGLSEVGVAEIKRVRSMVSVATVQNRYSVADRAHEDVLRYCEENEIGFIPWFPLAAGNLPVTGILREAAARLNVSAFQLALAWLLWHSPVMLPIPGTSRVHHLEENLAVADMHLDLTELRKLDRLSRA